MKKIQKTVVAFLLLVGLIGAPIAATVSMAQDAAPAAQAAGDLVDAQGNAVSGQASKAADTGFLGVVFGSGALGVILWFALFADGAAAIYFAVDCWVLIRPQKIMPQSLINNVQAAMAEGDVVKAQTACANEPSPMANILAAAFQHVEEGFDVIQEAVDAAADLETERIMQRLTWISVCANLAPSLGLLGTVQGMILTFDQLASGPAPQPSDLAGSIGMALWTTAAGLIVSIPSITMFYALRNNANRRILRMTAVTMEFLNSLRNVEVASEDMEQV
jgi:biopolymer transport protein ExbB